MIGQFDSGDHDDNEGFGPVSDLVLSLLAVLIVTGLVFWGALSKKRHEAEAARDAALTEVKRLTEELKEAQRTEIRVNLENDTQKYFAQGSSTLAMDQKTEGELLRQLQSLKERLREGDRQIEIVGYASPETHADSGDSAYNNSTRSARARRQEDCIVKLASIGLDFNSRLSLCRAAAIADFLSKHDIPMDCLKISAVGRSQSDILKDLYTRMNPDEAEGEINKPPDAALAHKLNDERKTELFVTRGKPNNICLSQLKALVSGK